MLSQGVCASNMKLFFLVTSLYLVAAHAVDNDVDVRLLRVVADENQVDNRELRRGGHYGGGRYGGGRSHGRHSSDSHYGGLYDHPEPTEVLSCAEPIVCDLRVGGHKYDHDVIERGGGGIRICRQSDGGKNRTLCVNSTAPILVYANDTCGCCNEAGDGKCPGTCEEENVTACPCTGYDDGMPTYAGVSIEFTRGDGWYGHHSRTKTKCVAQEFTAEAQIRGGTCTPCAVPP